MAGLVWRLLLMAFFVLCIAINSIANEMVKITDMLGRELSIPNRIERIIPLGSALRFITYMQCVEKVAGIEAYEHRNKDSAGRPYSLAIASRVDAIPAIGEGGPGKLPDFERVISVKPNLIIAMGFDISLVNNIQQKTGIPVLSLSYGGRGMLDFIQVEESLRILGKLCNKTQRAGDLITYINSLREDLHRRTKDIKKRPFVYVGAVSFSGRHGITSTQGDYMPLKWINGYNVADALKKSGPLFLDKEKVLQWDPEVIFIDMGGIELVREDFKKSPDFYHRLKAVKLGKVYSLLPFNFYHTNIEIALANAYYMGKLLYPERFRDIDPAKKADEIFRTFVGVPAYDRLKKEYHGFVKVIFSKDTIELR